MILLYLILRNTVSFSPQMRKGNNEIQNTGRLDLQLQIYFMVRVCELNVMRYVPFTVD